jgi:hypothetical protein
VALRFSIDDNAVWFGNVEFGVNDCSDDTCFVIGNGGEVDTEASTGCIVGSSGFKARWIVGCKGSRAGCVVGFEGSKAGCVVGCKGSEAGCSGFSMDPLANGGCIVVCSSASAGCDCGCMIVLFQLTSFDLPMLLLIAGLDTFGIGHVLCRVSEVGPSLFLDNEFGCVINSTAGFDRLRATDGWLFSSLVVLFVNLVTTGFDRLLSICLLWQS